MAKTQKKTASVAGSLSVILTLIICGALLIGVIAWAAVTKSANSMRNVIAMKVGEYEISGAEFEYQYNNAILTFRQDYEDILPYLGVDFDKDLGTQMYTDDMSWKDYFINSAVNALSEQYFLISAANEAGFELTEAQKDSAVAEMESLKSILNAYGIGLESYIQSTYGKNAKFADLKEYSIKNALAYNYFNNYIDSINIDEDMINEYYEVNKDDLETVAFHSYQFAYTVPSNVEEGDESYKDAAKAKAEAALAAITDEESIKDAIFAQLTDDEITQIEEDFETYSEDVYKASVSTDIANWLFDSSRKEGDKTVIEANGGFFVLYFVDRAQDDYETVNVRHILLRTSDVENIYTEDGVFDTDATAEAQEAADAEVYAKAEAVLNEWLAGDKTEESFAALANEKSEDTAEGGLYTQVTKGMMASEFDKWIFDESRKAGDYEIVKTDRYGYHIMYYCGTDVPAWHLEVIENIQEEEYNEYISELKVKYDVITYDDVMNRVD